MRPSGNRQQRLGHVRFQCAAALALATALANRVLAGASARTSARRPTQLLSVPNYYFTKQDWTRISPRHRLEQVLITVAQRCCGLNLLHPNEQTVGNLGAMIAAAYYPVRNPDPTTLKGLVRDIKLALQRLRPATTGPVNEGLPHLERYPLHPQQCPQEIWDSAYPDADDPPIQVELSNLGRIQRLMVGCLRSRDVRSPTSSGIDALVGLLQHGRLAQDQTIALPGGHQLQLTNPNTSGAPTGTDGMSSIAARASRTQQLQLGNGDPGSLQRGNQTSRTEETPEQWRAPLWDSPQLASVLNIGSVNTGTTPPALADGNAEEADVVEQLEKQAVAGRGGVLMLRPAGAGSDVKKFRIKGKQPSIEVSASVRPHVMKGKPNKKSGGKGKGQSSIKARPAAAVQKARRTATVQSVTLRMANPPVPKNEMGVTYYYKGGKIQVSLGKQGYRVFTRRNDIVDKLVKWDRFPNQLTAWKTALSMCAPR